MTKAIDRDRQLKAATLSKEIKIKAGSLRITSDISNENIWYKRQSKDNRGI